MINAELKNRIILTLTITVLSVISVHSDSTYNAVFDISFLPKMSVARIFSKDKPLHSNIVVSIFGSSSTFLSGISCNPINSITYKHTNGAQFSGIYNKTEGKLQGLQSAGIFNKVLSRAYGVQSAGIFNYSKGMFTGIQTSGITNRADDIFTGVQITGIVNSAKNSLIGAQWAGIVNRTNNLFIGAQWAGIVNVNNGVATGAQWAGITNIAKKDFIGIQSAAILNKVHGNMMGMQSSGIVNIVRGDFLGMQVGLINRVKNFTKGAQLGIINISDKNDAISIGAFSFVKGEGIKIDISLNELEFVTFGIRTGSKRFYNLFYLGSRTSSNRLTGTYGVESGILTPLKKIILENGISIQHIIREKYRNSPRNEISDFEYGNIVFKYNSAISYPLLKHLSFFGGLSAGLHRYSRNNGSTIIKKFTKIYTKENTVYTLFPGVYAGLRFNQ